MQKGSVGIWGERPRKKWTLGILGDIDKVYTLGILGLYKIRNIFDLGGLEPEFGGFL